MRGGDSSAPQSTFGSGQVPAYLDSYSVSVSGGVATATYAGSYSIPTSSLTLPGINANSHEGRLELSGNSQYLDFGGYNQPVSSTTPRTTDGSGGTGYLRVGQVSTSSTLVTAGLNTGATNSQFIRAAYSDNGTQAWVATKSPNGGLAYVTGIGGVPTTTALQTTTDWRDIKVNSGQLYGGTGSSSVGTHGFYAIGTGEPTSATPTNTLLTNSSDNSVSSFSFATLPAGTAPAAPINGVSGPNVAYVIGDPSGNNYVGKLYNDGAHGLPLTTSNLVFAGGSRLPLIVDRRPGRHRCQNRSQQLRLGRSLHPKLRRRLLRRRHQRHRRWQHRQPDLHQDYRFGHQRSAPSRRRTVRHLDRSCSRTQHDRNGNFVGCVRFRRYTPLPFLSIDFLKTSLGVRPAPFWPHAFNIFNTHEITRRHRIELANPNFLNRPIRGSPLRVAERPCRDSPRHRHRLHTLRRPVPPLRRVQRQRRNANPRPIHRPAIDRPLRRHASRFQKPRRHSQPLRRRPLSGLWRIPCRCRPRRSRQQSSAQVPRLVARVAANGTVDTTTALTDGSYSETSIRAVATDNGTRFWIAGDNADNEPCCSTKGGLRYVASLGACTSVNLSSQQNAGSSPTPDNIRDVGIFDGQLYDSSGSNSSIGKAVFKSAPACQPQRPTRPSRSRAHLRRRVHQRLLLRRSQPQ